MLNESNYEVEKNEEQKVLNNVLEQINSEINNNKNQINKLNDKNEEARGGDHDRLMDIKNNNEEIHKFNEMNNNLEQYKLSPYNTHINANSDGESLKLLFGEKNIEINKNSPDKLVWNNNNNLYLKFLEAMKSNRTSFTYGDSNYILDLYRNVIIKSGVLISIDTKISDNRINNSFDVLDRNLIELKRKEYISESLFDTIGLEQLKIITNHMDEDMLVQGGAGTGKSIVLLHRLANMIFQTNKDNQYENSESKRNELIKRTKIISPSKDLMIMYNELSKILKLNQIERFTPEEFYITLIKKYDNDIQLSTRVIQETKLNTNVLYDLYNKSKDDLPTFVTNEIDINSIMVKYIIGENTISFKSINSKILSIIKSELLIDDEDFGLLKNFEIKVYDDIRILERDLNNRNRNLYKIKRYLIDLLNKRGEKNSNLFSIKSKKKMASEIINKINGFQMKVISDILDDNLDESYELKLSFDNKNNDSLINEVSKLKEILNNFSIDTLINNKEYLLDKFIIKKEIRDSFKGLSFSFNNDIRSRIFQIADNIFGRNISYKQNSNYYKELLYDYIRTKFNFIIEYYLESYCQNIYYSYDECYERHLYRYKLYLILYLAYAYYGKLNESMRINIDEAQDYSANEYVLFRKVLGDKCVFDLYGDINQVLQNYRSIKDWNEVSFINTKNYFTLNYNYRNTIQIIDFVKDVTNIQMKGIGLEGDDVLIYDDIGKAFYDFYEDYLKYNNESDKSKISFAIIISQNVDIDVVTRDIKKYCELDDLDDFIFDEVNFDKISVIDVSKAKGLEFTGVLVIDSDFNNNELYVAMTRALNILHYYKGKAFVNNELKE